MAERAATTAQGRRRRILERPRLTRLLSAGQGRIKLLVGPAGYGKTTLAGQWLDEFPATWYRGTPASADVAALAAGLRGAVTAIVPGAGAALMERLPVTRQPEEEAHVLAEMLAGDLGGWPSDAWLAFDDYHLLTGTVPAERFVESLLLEAPMNVLVMTRQRPSWASSRRILYGDVFEIGRAELAMTEEEALELLAGVGPSAHDLIELAQGWPAVLSLASTALVPPPELIAAPHLYSFFAEEIYQRIDRRARRVLSELALYDADGRTLALKQLRPDEAEHTVRIGVESGFLTQRDDGGTDMHPLLRNFLTRKLTEERPKTVGKVVSRAVENLIKHEHWDEAFELTQQFPEAGMLPVLLESSAVNMLEAGRIPTLRSWIGEANDDEPVVRFAAAEIAFAEGRFHEAQAQAAIAARAGLANRELAARACLVGARAAHVASREDEAGALYARARDLAESPKLKHVAALGEVLVAIEMERPDAADLLRQFDDVELIDPTERVILADRRLALETRFGEHVDLQSARAASQLLTLVPDPLVRTAFRNVLGYALAAMGFFEESLELTQEQLADAEQHRLDFVLHYAHANAALAKGGQRKYVEAHELLDEAERGALRLGHRNAYFIAWALKMRVSIAQGAFDRVLSRALVLDDDLERGLRSEVSASYALAAAGAGYLERAEELAGEARRSSIGIEALINAELTLAVVGLRKGRREAALEHALAALAIVVRTGMIESFVFAYRGFPEILVCLMEEPSAHDDVTRILMLAGDHGLARSVVTPNRDRSILSLSPREKEVLSLLAQGLSNPQIGRALFISPVTVKVHVRHIFDKLGVKSRAAAAMRASQLGRE